MVTCSRSRRTGTPHSPSPRPCSIVSSPLHRIIATVTSQTKTWLKMVFRIGSLATNTIPSLTMVFEAAVRIALFRETSVNTAKIITPVDLDQMRTTQATCLMTYPLPPLSHSQTLPISKSTSLSHLSKPWLSIRLRALKPFKRLNSDLRQFVNYWLITRHAPVM